MTEFGIVSYGAYVPRLRLSRATIAEAHKWMAPGLKSQAKGSRAFTSWDEDAVTMAVEAARDALVGVDVAAIETLHRASNTAPYDDLQSAPIVAAAIRVPRSIRSLDTGRSQRAGTSTLARRWPPATLRWWSPPTPRWPSPPARRS